MTAPSPSAGFLRYPRGRLLAVVDDASVLEAALRQLQRAGIAEARIELFHGAPAAAAFDGTGAHHGALARIRRLVEFLMMDQAPDLAWYEAAVRDGRWVVSVRPAGGGQVRLAADALRSSGGHFINHFGLLATEEIERWHGPEPALPEYLLR
jgi:hypothetical protein